MKPEQRFRKKLIAGIRSRGGHAVPIESHETSSGVPDLNYYINNTENWLELKVWTKTNKKALRPSQIAWFRKRLKLGANPAIACQIEDNCVAIVTGPAILTFTGTVSRQKWIDEAEWLVPSLDELCDLIAENPSLVIS